ncbi:hypothetical protein ZIOFF_057115 [Zingiber officinale]|uniref:Uncharacterized protein n=1 Tax=Zingiber officinale TaxID=94328 RepID=A0A8J5F8Q3_ZINOF|nr:hypothetical protein ZIOFF_057115 [Zingiber officinale]
MVSPFVASPGTDRVSRSNPGAWLVLRPGYGVWKPWGRLEAWRERGGSGSGDGLGYRFELLANTAMGAGINLAESTLSATKGGKFTIDLTAAAGTPLSRSISPGCSPRGSRDFGHAIWPFSSYRGYVMSSSVAGEGRGGRSTVEVGVEHVGCTEDAADFVALAAAIDLSMDACRLFSHKLRRELSSPDLLGWLWIKDDASALAFPTQGLVVGVEVSTQVRGQVQGFLLSSSLGLLCDHWHLYCFAMAACPAPLLTRLILHRKSRKLAAAEGHLVLLYTVLL